jgi:hydrogenase maturation protease
MLISEEVRVLGMGNVLMGDDALGPWVIEELLANWDFPGGVCVLDVGTPGLDLTPYLADADTVLLVDAVKAEGPPGTIRLYSREEFLARPAGPRLSPHAPGLTEALLALDLVGCAPREILLVGVVPGMVARGIGLTPAVRTAVVQAAARIVDRLSRLGFPPQPKTRLTCVTPWWERPAAAGSTGLSV